MPRNSKHKVTASLATIVERQESLKETVKSLLPQVDRLNVYLHGYTPTAIPKFLKNPKIQILYDVEWGDLGDIDKLAWIDETKGYHLICDDDLIYPKDYAKKMVEAIDRYDKKAIVSFHGTVVRKLPIATYYQDRDVYPCLLGVTGDAPIDLPGTGVMGYHSDCGFTKADFRKEMPNMLDIHVGLWAKRNNIPLYVIAHPTNWIKHSEKVDLNKTIYAAMVNNDFFQTSLINNNPELFSGPKEYVEGLPIVSIVVINSRGKSNPEMLKMCYDSIRNQHYPNIEPIIVENYDKLITIGKGFNEGAKKAKGEWVYFLGDDDFLSPDFIQSLVGFIRTNPKEVSVTTYLTMFRQNEDKIIEEARELTPTGLWRKDYLMEHLFPEYLTRYVDTDYIENAKKRGNRQALLPWHYGYFYRSHPKQVSGHKALINSNESASWRTDDVKERLGELK